MKKCLILANGQPPRKSEINFLMKAGYETLICADGGANSAFRLNLTPDYIVGDLDSIREDVLKFYKGKSIIKHNKSQYSTDVEKCLKLAKQKKIEHVMFIGATGDRLDHTFCNLGIVLKFFDMITIEILHQKSLLSAHTGKVKLKTTKGEIVSIYGIDKKTKFTTNGFKYPLKNEPLPFGERESTSNAAISDEAEVIIKNGIAFIVRDFKMLKKNDYFSRS